MKLGKAWLILQLQKLQCDCIVIEVSAEALITDSQYRFVRTAD